jgi:hypothetical protein
MSPIFKLNKILKSPKLAVALNVLTASGSSFLMHTSDTNNNKAAYASIVLVGPLLSYFMLTGESNDAKKQLRESQQSIVSDINRVAITLSMVSSSFGYSIAHSGKILIGRGNLEDYFFAALGTACFFATKENLENYQSRLESMRGIIAHRKMMSSHQNSPT